MMALTAAVFSPESALGLAEAPRLLPSTLADPARPRSGSRSGSCPSKICTVRRMLPEPLAVGVRRRGLGTIHGRRVTEVIVAASLGRYTGCNAPRRPGRSACTAGIILGSSVIPSR